MCKERRGLGNTFWKRVSSEHESFNKNQRNECDTLWEICKKKHVLKRLLQKPLGIRYCGNSRNAF